MEGNYFRKDAIWRRLVVFEAVAIDLCTLSITIPRLENAKYLTYKGMPLTLFDASMNESIINTA